jgi:hypothetical protein
MIRRTDEISVGMSFTHPEMNRRALICWEVMVLSHSHEMGDYGSKLIKYVINVGYPTVMPNGMLYYLICVIEREATSDRDESHNTSGRDESDNTSDRDEVESRDTRRRPRAITWAIV